MVAQQTTEELERLRIAETGYTIGVVDQKEGTILLTRPAGTKSFMKGDPIQIVALEQGRPILASINFRGAVHAIVSGGIELKVTGHTVSEVLRMIDGFQIMAMRSEVDLTKRELQSLDFMQRRASPAVREIARIFLG